MFMSLICICGLVCCGCGDDDYERGIHSSSEPDVVDLGWFYESDDFTALVAECEDVLAAAYMEQTLIEERLDYPGYEGLPVKLYEYETGTDASLGIKKKGKVYMLNPSADKLARWVANACWSAKHSVDKKYLDQVCNQVLIQSGGQFPVCGIVYEDMDGTGYYPYAFKDGVTVYVADEEKWATTDDEGTKTCSDEQLEYCINLTDAQLKDYTGTYARICSTTREQYKAAGGKVDVGTSDSSETRKKAWLGVVRDLYKQAWESDSNQLMNAWAAASLKD